MFVQLERCLPANEETTGVIEGHFYLGIAQSCKPTDPIYQAQEILNFTEIQQNLKPSEP